MKKHKMIHKTLSVLLSLVVMANTLSLNAFAAEPTQDTVKVPTIEGGEKTEDVKVSVSVTENENGTTTTKKETEEGGYQTESGLTVEYESSETTKKETTNKEETGKLPEDNTETGEIIPNENAENKENEKSSEETNNKQEEKLVSAESNYIVVNEDETYGAEGGSQTTVSKGDGTEGDITLGLMEDGETADSKVTGTSGTAGTVTKPTNEDSKLKEEDPANFDQTTTTTTDRTADATISSSETTSYSYIGVYNLYNQDCDLSNYYIKYKKDGATEQYVDGYYAWNLIIKDDELNEGNWIGGMYCADMSTGAEEGSGYSIVNLEDAVRDGYYKEVDVQKLRAIIKNGFIRYDGTDEYADNDTNNQAALEAFRKKLLELKDNGTGLDDISKEQIEDLTWEQATVATQMAIWQIANREDEDIEVYAEGISGYEDKVDVANKLKNYLLSLKDDTATETKIRRDNQSIENIELMIGSKNQNGVDDQHDLYNVGLKFSLVVTPGIGDDLYVHVLDQDGKIKVTKCIPTEGQIGQEYVKVVTGVDGEVYYIIDDLVWAENTDFSLALKMEQELEKGVYVFQACYDQNGNSQSQNMIRMYSGTAKIDLGRTLTMRFNVEEADVTTTREWRKEWTKEVEYPAGPQDGDKDFKDKEEKDIPKTEDKKDTPKTEDKKDVPKTEVKLTPTVAKIQTNSVVQNTTAPKTSDQSQMLVWMTLILMSGVVICQAIARKRKF